MDYDHLEVCAEEIQCVAAALKDARTLEDVSRFTSIVISYLEEITEMIEKEEE